MSPFTHLFLGWLVAESAPLNRRERACVALAGAAPDLDGLGVIAEVATKNSAHPLLWFSEYHHVLCHNLLASVVASGVVAAIVGGSLARRAGVAALACLTWNLHIVCDVIGARGPDGHQWPIVFWRPFAANEWVWSGQWRLDSWQNLVITLVSLTIIAWLARTRGRTPLEMLSLRADAAVVGVIRKRWPPVPS
jgi:hypothetical protein